MVPVFVSITLKYWQCANLLVFKMANSKSKAECILFSGQSFLVTINIQIFIKVEVTINVTLTIKITAL